MNMAARGRTEAPPRPRPSAPPPADPVREEVRAAIAGAGDWMISPVRERRAPPSLPR